MAVQCKITVCGMSSTPSGAGLQLCVRTIKLMILTIVEISVPLTDSISSASSSLMLQFSILDLTLSTTMSEIPTPSLALQTFAAYNSYRQGSLGKLQGQGVTHFGGFVWRRILMEECVTPFA